MLVVLDGGEVQHQRRAHDRNEERDDGHRDAVTTWWLVIFVHFRVARTDSRGIQRPAERGAHRWYCGSQWAQRDDVSKPGSVV